MYPFVQRHLPLVRDCIYLYHALVTSSIPSGPYFAAQGLLPIDRTSGRTLSFPPHISKKRWEFKTRAAKGSGHQIHEEGEASNLRKLLRVLPIAAVCPALELTILADAVKRAPKPLNRAAVVRSDRVTSALKARSKTLAPGGGCVRPTTGIPIAHAGVCLFFAVPTDYASTQGDRARRSGKSRKSRRVCPPTSVVSGR